MKRCPSLAVAVAVAVACAWLPLAGGAAEIGPERGSLVIAGGGELAGTGILERFIELAGGPGVRIVLIPTAIGGDDFGPAYRGRAAAPFLAAGAAEVELLHTRDREAAGSDAFVAPIRRADGVWFGGGRQWRLADAYLGTRTEEALWELLERGGAIGGSSAGATIQGSYLMRGDSRGNMIMMGDHEEGFGFLKASAIDQHLLRRNRQFDLIEVVRAKPELLGIGLDESTAVVVRGDTMEVIGRTYVAIYDAAVLGDGGRFYLLAPGDRFDLAARRAVRSSRSRESLWLPQVHERARLPPESLGRYVGQYGAGGTGVEITRADNRLFLQVGERQAVEIVPLSESVFFEAAWGGKVVFELDPGEAVGSLTLPDGRTLQPLEVE